MSNYTAIDKYPARKEENYAEFQYHEFKHALTSTRHLLSLQPVEENDIQLSTIYRNSDGICLAWTKGFMPEERS